MDGPPLKMPTWENGVALSPTCKLEGMQCDGRFDGEMDHGKVTGNNVVSWKPGLNDWYETVKLNYGYDFTDPTKQRRAYPCAWHPEPPLPDTWAKMDHGDRLLAGDGRRWFPLRHVAHAAAGILELAHRPRAGAHAGRFLRRRSLRQRSGQGPGQRSGHLAASWWEIECDVRFARRGFDAVYDDPSYKALKNIYDGPGWANDLDHARSDDFIFENSVRYAENHDEVRLAGRGNWGGIGMNVGRAVTAILYGVGRGSVMLYSGQEVGEPAAGAEGFGGDDARTSIFDYWSMPELVKWTNDHKYDGGKLSAEQKTFTRELWTSPRNHK